MKLSGNKPILTRQQFIKSLGIIGIDSGKFISEKIFDLMDENGDGNASLDGFIQYSQIFLKSDEIDKAILSFFILDADVKGYLVFKDF